MSCVVSSPAVVSKPAEALSIRGNFGWTAAGNAVNAACQWGTISVLAKLASSDLVGQYALAVAIATPVFMLAQLNLRSVLATDVTGSHAFRDYRRLRFLSILAGFAATLVFAWANGSKGEGWIIAAMGLIQSAEWASDIYFGWLQLHERMDRIAISLIIRGIGALAALAFVMFLTRNLLLAVAAAFLVRVILYAVYDSGIAVRGMIEPAAGKPRWADQWLLLRTALPLGLVMMALSLSSNVPRYFIADRMSNSALGIFAALASLTSAGGMVVNALGQTVTPRLARLFAAGDFIAFRRMTARLVWLGLAIGASGAALALIAGRRILLLLFRPEYADQANVLALLSGAAGIGFAAQFAGYAITAARRFREQVPIQAAAIAVSAAAAYLLIPRIGLTGAALSIAASYVAQAAASWQVLRSALEARQ
ncbi:MAG TPA: oligosaccharide flippase family protein [Bryobacteraceae bacterium]|jgi:O-antigen/teichoic acid export membrane protein|nr:oligosaccharide flippase family protein [Bryobacteraceae bacterium]